MRENNGEEMKRRDFIRLAAAATVGLPFILDGKEKKREKSKEKKKKEKGEWRKIYENPNIKVVLDTEFNKNFNETGVVFKLSPFAVDPKSKRVFVADFKHHEIHIFKGNGEFLKTFGQKGGGKGDLSFPAISGIFEGKLFVTSRYGKTRISEFNLDGGIVSESKVEASTRVYPLGDNRRVYYETTRGGDRSKQIRSVNLMEDGRLVETFSYHEERQYVPMGDRTKLINPKYYFGERVVLKSNGDFVVCGGSGDKSIHLISKDGKTNKIPVFEEERQESTKNMIEKRKKEAVHGIIDDRIKYYKKYLTDEQIKEFKKNVSEAIKKKSLPYYNDIKIDSDGNILFVREDLEEILIYRPSEDKKTLSIVAKMGKNNELTKKVISGKNVEFVNGSIFGFWKNEDGEWVFQKHIIKSK